MLRGGIDITEQPSGLSIASTILEQPFVSLELGLQNPVAYPFLAPIDDITMHQDTLNRLTRSRGGSSVLPLYVPAPTDGRRPHGLTRYIGIQYPLNRA